MLQQDGGSRMIGPPRECQSRADFRREVKQMLSVRRVGGFSCLSLVAFFVLALAPAAVPRSGSAVQVTIVYDFLGAGANNTPGLLGGAPITGLTGIVQANVNAAGTSFITASPQLMLMRVTSVGGATLQWANPAGGTAGNNGIWSNSGLRPGYLPNGLTVVQNSLAGSLIVGFAVSLGGYTNTVYATLVQGTEVKRVLPEPSMGLQLALGATALFGMVASARYRRRR